MSVTLTDDKDLNIIDTTQPSVEGETSFEEMANAMPETARGFLDIAQADNERSMLDAAASSDNADRVEEKRTKTIKMSKKMKKSMDKLKGKVSNIPIMWFHQQAKEHPEWELDDEEKDLIKDSIDTVFEVLDIQVEINPIEWTLQSIWWIIGYPIVAFVFLFLTKKSASIEKEQQIGVSV